MKAADLHAHIQDSNPTDSYSNAPKKQGWPLWGKSLPLSSLPNRRIISNMPDQRVCDNSINTSKYTLINFVPKNLTVQFSKIANIYFLIVGVMQMIPTISVSGGFPVIFVPLSIVVGVSALKDFFEDLKRKQSDSCINNKLAQSEEQSRDHGNVIKVKTNQQFPADVILLGTSEANQSCFIETKNLDGQTNLKYKKVRPQVYTAFTPATLAASQDSADVPVQFEEFSYQRPNPYIHTFTGSYRRAPLDNNHVVLRGCSLKITEWAIGLAIYTGADSKIMLNSNKTRQKKSRLEFRMGIIVAVVFMAQMLLTFLSALLSTILTSEKAKQLYFQTSHQLITCWGSWILLFTNFVPISLIVSLEIVKYIQGINIMNAEFQTREPAEVTVQTSTLNQELGQIQHFFSDKTGTLTRNSMSFKYMIAGFKIYGCKDDQIPSRHPNIEHVDFHDPDFDQFLSREKITFASNEDIFELLLSFCICHNVIIEKEKDGNGSPKLNASSPDELAFINMAKYCDWHYLGMDAHNVMQVRAQGRVLKYRLLHTIEFDSDRKRMSVIVEKIEEEATAGNRIFVYCKGADNVVFERLEGSKSSKKIELTKQRLSEWSSEGLRTLVFARRQINREYYRKWAIMYAFSLSQLSKQSQQEDKQIRQKIKNDKIVCPESAPEASSENQFMSTLSKLIIDSKVKEERPGVDESPIQLINQLLNDSSLMTESQKKFLDTHLSYLDSGSESKGVLDAKIATTQELEAIIEKEMMLIGATAIEDKLQDNVKETITRIRKAGVMVWMLTGDKQETAINIGVSCGILNEDMARLLWQQSVQATLEARSQYSEGRKCCLVVTGDDLLTASSNNNEPALLKLVNSCTSVICCRVTPKQKQDMVWLMRKNKCTTLSIGDGANDVNMINTAHVGVGIKGVEGAQAALCSDYAISQFQLVGELMLHHGRECYRKNSQLILFTFYKNLLLVLPQLWYGALSQFSSANMYDPWVYQLYNVMYTSMPITIFAIYDFQHSSQVSLNRPSLYTPGINNEFFNLRFITSWFLSPILFSFFLAVFTFPVMQTTISSGGYCYDFMASGMTIFAECVFICNIKILTISYKFSIGLLGCIFMGIVFYYITFYIASRIFTDTSQIVNLLGLQFVSFQYWAVVVSNVLLVVALQMTMVYWKILSDQSSAAASDSEHKQDLQMKLIGSQRKEEDLAQY